MHATNIRHKQKFWSMLLVRLILLCQLLVLGNAAWAADALPSWNDGASKQAITRFVAKVTDKQSKDYVSPAERIAVFDNDGTLWSEQPMYFQVLFAFDRLRELAPAHPEWQERPLLKAVIDGDMKGALAGGEKGLFEVVMATHAGPLDEFHKVVRAWIGSAKNPVSKRRYLDMTFLPMRELLDFLRANEFKTYIISGGDTEFMRPWVEQAYGVAPEQVISSRLALALEVRDGQQIVSRLPKLDIHNDREGKVLSIANFIGRRPIFAFGNSDGDLPMLQWTADGAGARFVGLVHHTDAEREVAYDRASSVGRLDKALDVAQERGWILADMKRDWKQVYAPAAIPVAQPLSSSAASSAQ